MPCRSDDEYDYYNDYYSDPSNDDSADDDNNDLDDDYDDDNTTHEDPDDILYKDDNYVSTQWKSLMFNDVDLFVSNKGAIQFPDSIFHITYGDEVPGTPYRSIRIEISENVYRNYYVHEIVWVAFHDNIPIGWEVGHKDRTEGLYNNELSNLEIYKSYVEKDFYKPIRI